MASITTPGVQSALTQFDALGNLTSRADSAAGQPPQTFAYDRLNRLTTQDGASVATYDPAGNLTSRAGVGGYAYYPGTHRVQSAGGHSLSYDANGNVTAIAGPIPRSLSYLPFNLPSRISAGGNTLDYLYDGAHARIKETSQTAQGTAQTWYLGAYEEHTRTDGEVEQRHYLATPDGPVGMITRRSTSASVVYWHRDHLGSLVALSDPAGGILQRFAYDAWGGRTGGTAASEERGYTGHEHLLEAGLIHMNGRLYFEGIGRFLQPDPVVQAPYDGQNYNRYTYVMNNPLSLTDPSGYSWWTRWRRTIFAAAAAIITYGAASGWMTAAAIDGGASTAFAMLGAGGTTATLTPVGMAMAGAAAGFAAGGIQGGSVESAIYGAVTGGISGGIAGSFGNSWSLARVAAQTTTSAALVS